MLMARVEGQVWGEQRVLGLAQQRLLVVRPLGRGGIAAGETRVVVDQLGAGVGELVLIAHGSQVRDLTVGPGVATKDVVVALVDAAEVDGARIEAER